MLDCSTIYYFRDDIISHPFWLQLVLALLEHRFLSFENTLFGYGSLTSSSSMVQYPKCAYGPYC